MKLTMAPLTRRALLATTAALTLPAASTQQPVHLGGPIFLNSADPAVQAHEHRRLGYSAAYCPKAEVTDAALVAAIQKAFAAENVVIAEVGAWCNLMDPDAPKRRANLQYVTDRMALSEAVGARCCVDYAGSFSPTIPWGPHPGNLSQDFFGGTVENCRKIIDAVKPSRTVFSIEMMGWSVPDSPDSYLALIKAIDRKQFGVHMDVCNGVNSPRKFYENAKFIEECFSKLGQWIASCHAKDLAWIPELNVHFQEVIPGRGSIDYKTYLRELAKLPQAPPLMLEHLKTAEQYAEGHTYILKMGREAGVVFA